MYFLTYKIFLILLISFTSVTYSKSANNVADTICTKNELYSFDYDALKRNNYKVGHCLINQLPEDSFKLIFKDQTRLRICFQVDLCGHPLRLEFIRLPNNDTAMLNSIEHALMQRRLKLEYAFDPNYNSEQRKIILEDLPDSALVFVPFSLNNMNQAIRQDFGIEVEEEANKMQCEPYDVYKTYINKWVNDNDIEFYDAKYPRDI